MVEVAQLKTYIVHSTVKHGYLVCEFAVEIRFRGCIFGPVGGGGKKQV